MTPPTLKKKKVIRIDASSLKESACGRKLFLISKGYTGDKLPVDIVYGSAFHKVVETYDLTKGDETISVKAGQDYLGNALDSGQILIPEKKKHLNLGHLFFSSNKYFIEAKTNPIFTDNKPLVIADEVMVEKKFSIKVYEDDDYIVLGQGTIDKVAEMLKGNTIALADWKTTSMFDADEYFQQYIMSCQLRFYIWAMKRMASRFPDRQFAKRLEGVRIIAFVNGAFLKSPLGVDFKRSKIFNYGPGDMISFEEMFMEEVLKLVASHRKYDSNKQYPPAQGIINQSCQGHYGYPCKYHKVCSSMVGLDGNTDSDRLFESLLQTSMKRIEYRPLTFGGEGKL